MIAKFIKKVKAHGSLMTDDLGEIFKMVELPNKRILTIGNDGYMKVFNQNLQVMKQIATTCTYLLTIHVSNDYVFLGQDTGKILIFDGETFDLIKTIKIGEDCVSSIEENEEQLVAVTFAGDVTFLNKNTFQMEKHLNLETQLQHCKYFQGKLYIAGMNSFIIDPQAQLLQLHQRIEQFIQHQGRLYGINDAAGFFCYSHTRINTAIPCDHVISHKDKIIGIFDQIITIFKHEDSGLSWKCQKVNELKAGYAIKSMLAFQDDTMIAAGETGQLYKFQIINAAEGCNQ